MNKNELQKLYKNKKVKINFDKWFGENYSYMNFYQESVNKETGELSTSDYPLDATVLTDTSIIDCMLIDPKTWEKELASFPFRFDKTTEHFFSELNKETYRWSVEELGNNPSDEELSKIRFYMPIAQEWYLWNIYLILNEIHKYLFNEPYFGLAEELVNDIDEEAKKFVSWIMDIKKFRKNLDKLLPDIAEPIS